MSLHKNYENQRSIYDFNDKETPEELNHKRHVRRELEARLERKRLKAELEDEINGEFDWGDLDP
ncbi:MAG: hypothetical protein NTW94_06815 [Legionellales bacterium]|nr:hypothetical protein [Legionellales bacterium]